MMTVNNMNKETIIEEKIKDEYRDEEEHLYLQSRIKDFKAFNDEFAEYLKEYGIPTTKN